MKKNVKGDANLQTPIKDVCNTAQGFTTTQRYKKQSLQNQFKDTISVFYNGIYTMKMVAEKLGIDRANICWYVDSLRKSNSIYFVKKDRCKITKYTAGYYTTNNDFAPEDNQLKLFTF